MRVDSSAMLHHSQRLLDWYDVNARTLPWRSPPGMAPPDPYRVWLSEIMLQQTTVASVKGYFELFTTRWPTVAALAAADDADVMQAWAGLGYYARARNLLACGRAVVTDHGGRFPDSEAGLRTLPGIGPYTAAAVAAIAFGAHATVVDGNVERVVARLFAVEAPMPAAKPELHALAAKLTPSKRSGDYAQAMMDLGATICTPRSPDCGACPVTAGCAALKLQTPTRFPVKAAKVARPTRQGTIYWLRAGDAVLVTQRPPRGLLGGMRALPTDDWATVRPEPAPPADATWQPLPGSVRHV
ncbi:MAG TPA: A/G-specific adenine glycosylase, partial [Polymorphobacter sp.]|nr:A/G-specific adenine glycosylase [Polymorphobacter sp.]